MTIPCSIAGIGKYLPDDRITNADLEKMVETSDEWIVQRTGIRSRHVAPAHQSTSDLAYEAGMSCLKNAGVAPEEVDLIMVATCTPDHIAPSVSCIVQDRMGCHQAAAAIGTEPGACL